MTDSSQSGTLCFKCGKRPGRFVWGDTLALTHGGGPLRCGVCVYRPQLAYALQRTVLVPVLAARLLWAWGRNA